MVLWKDVGEIVSKLATGKPKRDMPPNQRQTYLNGFHSLWVLNSNPQRYMRAADAYRI
jgi:hypothetical protein